MKVREIFEHRSGFLPPTEANIAKVKTFLMQKWIERNKEAHEKDEKYREKVRKHHRKYGETIPDYALPQDFVPPNDLSSSCKYNALFASIIFGGRMNGNYDHYFVRLPNGKTLDINADAKDVQDLIANHKAGSGDDPYRHDDIFCGQALRSDKRNVSGRVVAWLNEFCRENGLNAQFIRTHSGAISLQEAASPLPNKTIAAIITEANKNGFNGFGGNCGAAAVAINNVLFNGRGKLMGACNAAFLKADHFIGHIFVSYRRTMWDSDGFPKTLGDVESWGMLDPEDSDYTEQAEDLGIEWNEEWAYEVEVVHFDDAAEVAKYMPLNRLHHFEALLKKARRKIAAT